MNGNKNRKAATDYMDTETKLLKSFKKSMTRARFLLISRFGETKTADIESDCLKEYRNLIPQIPYIGDKNPMLVFFLPTVRCLAIYRALQKHGYGIDTVGQFIYEAAKIEVDAIPGIIRKLMGFFWFTSFFRRRIKRRAKLSQNRLFKDDFVFSCIDGNGEDFDFGIDYIECANCKFLIAQNAIELAPYICETDRIASELLGWGLTRTKTIADGKDKCDFRFKKHGKTFITGSSVQIQK